MARTFSVWLLGLFFILAGWNHFKSHATYVAIMPPYLPWPNQLVDISGLAEILGGIGLIVKFARKAAGAGLIILLIAVFPANVNMALHHVMPGSWVVPTWALWLRLPMQAVLIAWVWWSALICPAALRQSKVGSSLAS
jgi:uncharacterized membrane protein